MKNATIAFLLLLVSAAALAAPPETVMITYRPAAGNEAALRKVIADHWTTAAKLNLVNDAPHIIVKRGNALIEIFTWKDAAIPDNAPPEILKIWGEMTKLIEKNGMTIDEVELVR